MNKLKHLTDEDRIDIVKLYGEGVSTKEIAEKYNVKEPHIRRMAFLSNVYKRNISQEAEEKIIENLILGKYDNNCGDYQILKQIQSYSTLVSEVLNCIVNQDANGDPIIDKEIISKYLAQTKLSNKIIERYFVIDSNIVQRKYSNDLRQLSKLTDEKEE